MIRLFLAALALACLLSPADAKPRQHAAVQSHASCIPTSDIMRPCAYQPNFLAGVRSIRVTMKRVSITHKANKIRHKSRVLASESITHRDTFRGGLTFQPSSTIRFTASSEDAKIIAHPPGCPRIAFCGCGAAVRVFGHSIRNLWLAANWFKFPRAAPSAGMVAVKRHHVFVLEQHLGGDVWLAFDANSGRHLTRLHPRSIAGFAIVNPRAG